MKVTDFARSLNRYFNDYLVNDRGSSPKTIEAYRYAFIQFIDYLDSQKRKRPENIKLQDVNRDNIIGMLNWLETSKKVSASTRNHRLATFKSFASFLRIEHPEFIEESVHIQKIKPKKFIMQDISYLKSEGIKLLLSQIDQSGRNGRRDYTMLILMYTTGIRVSEIIAIRGRDVSLSNPKTVVIHGKGSKIRHVPIVKQIVPLLERYLNDNKCLLPHNLDNYIFRNHSNEKLSRQGINYVIAKYAKKAREINPAIIPENCSPHTIRHSSAMSLIENGADLITIRDLLGHASVQTTEIYAKISAEKRRAAIEAASKEIVPMEDALWENSTSLKEWLRGITNKKLIM